MNLFLVRRMIFGDEYNRFITLISNMDREFLIDFDHYQYLTLVIDNEVKIIISYDSVNGIIYNNADYYEFLNEESGMHCNIFVEYDDNDLISKISISLDENGTIEDENGEEISTYVEIFDIQEGSFINTAFQTFINMSYLLNFLNKNKDIQISFNDYRQPEIITVPYDTYNIINTNSENSKILILEDDNGYFEITYNILDNTITNLKVEDRLIWLVL